MTRTTALPEPDSDTGASGPGADRATSPDEGEARGLRPEVEAATPETFEARVMQRRGLLVVVDFWGPRCPNCEVFAAHRERLLDALAGAPMTLVTVNAYAHPELATRFAVHGIPTFVLVRDGVVLGRMSQFRGADFWLAVVREHLPAATAPTA